MCHAILLCLFKLEGGFIDLFNDFSWLRKNYILTRGDMIGWSLENISTTDRSDNSKSQSIASTSDKLILKSLLMYKKLLIYQKFAIIYKVVNV